MNFWNREVETMSRDQLADVQLKGLQKSLRRVWKSEWSRNLLKNSVLPSCGNKMPPSRTR